MSSNEYNPIYTQLINLQIDDVYSLYQLRQKHLNKLHTILSQQQHLSKADASVFQTISEELQEVSQALKEVEDQLRYRGLPTDPSEFENYYSSFSEVIQTLKSAQEISEWLRNNFPDRYKRKLHILNSSTHLLNPLLTGEWRGKWTSEKAPSQTGDVVMALCQIDSSLLGSGAFVNSIFYKAYLEGEVEDHSVNIELFVDYMPIVCAGKGNVYSTTDTTIIRGNYDVANYDHGTFEITKYRTLAYIEAQRKNNDTDIDILSETPEEKLFGIDLETLKQVILQKSNLTDLNDASLDLINEMKKVELLGKIDVDAAIGKARKITEIVIKELYTKHIGGRFKPLFEMIELLHTRGILPRKIHSYFNTVRIVGNLSVHYESNNVENVTMSDVKIIGILTAYIVEWYILIAL